jgi:hypothetical protein
MANERRDISIHLGLKTSQKKMNAINVTMIKAKPKPINDMGHHFLGLR